VKKTVNALTAPSVCGTSWSKGHMKRAGLSFVDWAETLRLLTAHQRWSSSSATFTVVSYEGSPRCSVWKAAGHSVGLNFRRDWLYVRSVSGRRAGPSFCNALRVLLIKSDLVWLMFPQDKPDG
jgi:hypothetical protein